MTHSDIYFGSELVKGRGAILLFCPGQQTRHNINTSGPLRLRTGTMFILHVSMFLFPCYIMQFLYILYPFESLYLLKNRIKIRWVVLKIYAYIGTDARIDFVLYIHTTHALSPKG
jgi:hypothetical protein